MKPKRVEVLGVPVDCVDMNGALVAVDEMVAEGRSATIVAVNPEKVMKAREDPDLLGFLRGAQLLIPDGIGVVLAVRLLEHERIERVPGSELMPAICARAVERGYTIFVFGATHDVNEMAVEALRTSYPGIQIVGSQHGYLSEEEMPRLIARINLCAPDVLFVALGSPRQEAWIAKYVPNLRVRVCQGVGGTLDVLAGTVKRAPPVFRRLHLEWLFRLVTDPRRAARQMVLPRFAYHVVHRKLVGVDLTPSAIAKSRRLK